MKKFFLSLVVLVGLTGLASATEFFTFQRSFLALSTDPCAADVAPVAFVRSRRAAVIVKQPRAAVIVNQPPALIIKQRRNLLIVK